MPELVWLLIVVIVLVVIFWLLGTYVAPALPSPIGKVVLAVVAVIVILLLCNYFFGWGWFGPPPHRVRH